MDPLRIGILGASRIAPNALFAPASHTGDHLVAVAEDALAQAIVMDACYEAAGLPLRPETNLR